MASTPYIPKVMLVESSLYCPTIVESCAKHGCSQNEDDATTAVAIRVKRPMVIKWAEDKTEQGRRKLERRYSICDESNRTMKRRKKEERSSRTKTMVEAPDEPVYLKREHLSPRDIISSASVCSIGGRMVNFQFSHSPFSLSNLLVNICPFGFSLRDSGESAECLVGLAHIGDRHCGTGVVKRAVHTCGIDG